MGPDSEAVRHQAGVKAADANAGAKIADPRQISDSLVHVEIGSAVVDPTADAFGRAIGTKNIYVDHDAALVECEGDRNRLWLGGRRTLGNYGRGENQDGKGTRKAHNKDCSGSRTL